MEVAEVAGYLTSVLRGVGQMTDTMLYISKTLFRCTKKTILNGGPMSQEDFFDRKNYLTVHAFDGKYIKKENLNKILIRKGVY